MIRQNDMLYGKGEAAGGTTFEEFPSRCRCRLSLLEERECCEMNDIGE